MIEPSEPKKIVLINSYYPNGLTKQDIANHYNENKDIILKESDNRPIVMFMSFFGSDDNITVRRKHKENNRIILTQNNYDDIMSGYVISIAAETPDPTPYWCIDMDYSNSVSLKEKIESLDTVVKIISSHVVNIRITNSSSGYHIYGYLKHKQSLSQAKRVLSSILKMGIPNDMMVGRGKRISIDLTPMNRRGCATVVGALTKGGIVCTDITDSYKKAVPERDFKIK